MWPIGHIKPVFFGSYIYQFMIYIRYWMLVPDQGTRINRMNPAPGIRAVYTAVYTVQMSWDAASMHGRIASTHVHRTGDHGKHGELPSSGAARAPDSHQGQNWAVRMIALDPWSVPVALIPPHVERSESRMQSSSTGGTISQLY